MLTQLSTVKSRLAIDVLDVQYDALLTTAIDAVSFRFDKETNRTLARTVDTTFEFDASDVEIRFPASQSKLSRSLKPKLPSPQVGSSKPPLTTSSAVPASFLSQLH